MTTTLKVSIWRQAADRAGAFQEFEVPRQDNQTVLDVVTHVQQSIDSTLSYRFSCRVGMCGSCAMMVNGEPRWTCRTHVEKVTGGNQLTIAPLRNLPVIRDLVADMDPFFDKWTKADARHHPVRDRTEPIPEVDPKSAQRVEADAGIECINCAVCYAACDTVSGQPEYLGPAALNRAWTIVNDERVPDNSDILKAVSGEGGCQNCHSMGACTHYCPNELNPMRSIAGLKRAAARQWWKG